MFDFKFSVGAYVKVLDRVAGFVDPKSTYRIVDRHKNLNIISFSYTVECGNNTYVFPEHDLILSEKPE